MATPRPKAPIQQKEMDERKWTTPEQKAHLLSKLGEYSIAQSCKALRGWFTVKLQTYFNMFPTGPVTVGDCYELTPPVHFRTDD